MLDSHNLVIKGIKKASGATSNWWPCSGGYTEIFYNTKTGEVWTVDQVSFGQSTYTVYDDPSVIKVTNTEVKMTMQEIADAIYLAVCKRNADEIYWAACRREAEKWNDKQNFQIG